MQVLLLSNEKKKKGKRNGERGIIETYVKFGCHSKGNIAGDSQAIRHEPHVLSMIKA